MTYYKDNDILIRNMEPQDAQVITDGEIAQGWDADAAKYHTRLRDQAEGRAIALVAEYRGNVAGYVNVYLNAAWGAFGGAGILGDRGFRCTGEVPPPGHRKQADGRCREDRGGAFRRGLSGCGPAQRLRQRPENVHQAGVCSRWGRCLVQGFGLPALCRLPK